MEEFDVATLGEHGYMLDKNNALTTVDGQYLESVTIDGKTMSSAISQNEFDKVARNSLILAESGFTADPYSSEPSYVQEDAVISKHFINEYQENSKETVIPEDVSQNDTYNDVFEQDRQEKIENGESAYPDSQSMVEGEEEDTFIQNINEQDRPLYKNLTKQRKELLEQDPDIDATSQKFIEETNKDLEENSWYNPENITLHLSNIIDKGMQTFIPTGTGMTEENQKKLKEIDAQIKKLEVPYAFETITNIESSLGKIKQLREASPSAQATLRYIYAQKILEKQKSNLEDFVSDGGFESNFDSNIFTVYNAVEFGTRGLLGLITEVPAEIMLKKDINNDEELDPSQKVLANAFSTKAKIGSAQIKQNFWHEVSTSINESLQFLGFGKLGRKAFQKSAKKALTSGTKLGKLKGGAIYVGGQAITHPNTYSAAAEQYSGNINQVEDENGNISFTTDEHTYRTLNKQYDLRVEQINEFVSQGGLSQEQTDKLVEERNLIVQAKNSLEEPMGLVEAFLYGSIESAKEAFAETYFGPLFGSGVRGAQKALNIKKVLIKSPLLNKIGKGFSSRRAKFNTDFSKTTLPGQRLIGSNIEEWGEEVFVQLIPTVGSDWEGYKEQVGELLTSDWHLKTFATVGTMGVGAQGIGAISQGVDKYILPALDKRSTRIQKKKAYRDIISTLKDSNISEEDFSNAYMRTGQGDFSIVDYNNRITELQKEGLYSEAAALRTDVLHKQAVNAVNNGQIKGFKQMISAAKDNKNLSADTKQAMSSISKEVNMMLHDNSTFVNSKTVTDIKSKIRFTKKGILDLGAEQVKYPEAQEEVSDALAKEGISLADFTKEVTPEFQEKVAKIRRTLSQEGEKILLLETVKAEMQRSVGEFNAILKDAISVKTQNYLKKTKVYQQSIDKLNKKIYGGKMTATQFKDEIVPRLKENSKINRLLNKEEVKDLNTRIFNTFQAIETQRELENQEIKKTLKKVDTQTKATQTVEITPIEEVTAQTVEILNASIAEQVNIQENDEIFLGEEEEEYDEALPVDKKDDNAIKALQEWAKQYTKEENTPPIFEDFWRISIGDAEGKNAYDKNTLEWLGFQWDSAGLGNSGWKKIWTNNYTSLGSMAKSILGLAKEKDKSSGEIITENKETAIKSTEKSLGKKPISPATGQPITKGSVIGSYAVEEITLNFGKTDITSPKGNYSGIKYENTEEQDGTKKVYSKEDVDTSIPFLNTSSHLDIKDLLHKDHNQPGDVLSIRVSDEADWDNPKIKVFVGNSNSGKATKYITFSNWIVENQPKGMTLGDFKKTDEFISKVPMFYVGKKGTDIMHIPDTDWYNALNLIDTTEDATEVNINAPSMALQQSINNGKETTSNLRKEIASGQVTKGKILTKEGGPLIPIPRKDEQGNDIPAKPLSEVGQDNQLATFDGITFKGLDRKVPLGEEIVINNLTAIKKIFKKNKKNSVKSYYLSPIYKQDGKQYVEALSVLRKNENNEDKAFTEDVETAKYILAANKVVKFKEPKFNMTLVQAESIRSQILKEIGMDIHNVDNANSLANSLINIVDSENKYDAFHKAVPVFDKKDGKWKKRDFIFGLYFGDFKAVQNTNLDPKKSHGITIKKENGIFQVTKETDTYEEFLKTRLFTNIMSYNMGTEQEPAFTHSVQPMIQIEPLNTGQKVQTVQEQENTQVSPPIKTSMSDLGLTEKDNIFIKETKTFLKSINSLNETQSQSDQLPPTLDGVDTIKAALNTIGGLSSKNQREIIDSLLGTILQNFKKGTKISGDFSKEISVKFKKRYLDIKQESEEREEVFVALQNKFPEDEGIQNLLSNLRVAQENSNIILDNYNQFFAKAFNEGKNKNLIVAKKGLDTTEDVLEWLEGSEQEQYEKDHNKSSNEVIHKEKISTELKRVFSTIYAGKVGFLGTPIPESFDVLYNATSTFLISPLPTDPSFKNMMAKLKELSTVNSWAEPLIKKLEGSSLEIKNGFVSNMYKYTANAKFVGFTKENTNIVSSVWFSNANSFPKKMLDSWNNNFIRGSITTGENLNTEKLTSLAKEFESWGEDKHTQSEEVLRNWLADFGFNLTDDTWKDLVLGKLVINQSGGPGLPMSFESLFLSNSSSRDKSKQLFDNLYKFAVENKDKKALDYTKNNNLVPSKEMGNILKGLITLEKPYNTSLINITRRDGEKTVSEIVFPNFFLESINKLINSADGDKSYIQELRKIPFSGNSLLLELLEESPEMASILNYGEVGLMSMKNMNSRSPKFSKVEQISPIDYVFHQRAMFQDMKVEKLNVNKDGFDMRVASVSTPTNSDKGRMMLMKTGVYDLYTTDLAFDVETPGLKFTPQLRNMLYKRLIEPELDRILNPVANTVKDYDKGAGRFNMIPIINTLKDGEGITVQEYLKTGTKEEFKDKYFDKISEAVEEILQTETDNSLLDIKNFSLQNNIPEKNDNINNFAYLNGGVHFKDTNQKKRAATLDYIINSNISNMNIMQTIAGDPALYFKSKLDPNAFDMETQIQISKDLGINLGKRLALMIAPGNILTNSKDEQYIQLFLKDNSVVAPNIKNIIGWHYGKSSLKEVFEGKTYEEHIEDLKNDNITEENLDQLKLKFAKVASFLQIENTDAQEMTTLREHLRVLEGLGTLSEENKEIILNKVYGEATENLSQKELDLVLQPMKPVYTGEKFDRDIDGQPTVRRIIYIKSSSFPLIPQLVNGTDLEPLMKKMEEIEEKHGKKVRASYQSANKVGAMDVALDPLNPKDLEKLDIVNQEDTSPLHSLVLERQGFKIQQEVPFKSDKVGDDKISMGTQIFKLLFGDGIKDIKTEDFDGSQLSMDFFDTFKEITDISREDILDELNLDDNYDTDNEGAAMASLQKLLVKMGNKRNFSENDIKSFEIQGRKIKGDPTYYFKQPLWFSGNSNKIESMFNSIINNGILKQKLPGNSFVVGSNNGLTLINQEKADLSEVVYLGDYRGETLQGTEVLVSSKIKLEGKLIDLFEEDDNDSYVYLKKLKEGGYTIKEDKISPELFNNFTFRTPTSSHGTASNIKIVGFIPAIMGDLMITPSNFVTQMGQDFDVDKLNNYQFYHYKNPKTGRIERLNETIIEHKLTLGREKYKLAVKVMNKIKSSGAYPKKEGGAILKDLDAWFMEILGSEEYSNMFDVDYDNAEQKLKEAEKKLTTIPREFKKKMAQNKFIEIHNTVYNSTSKEVQSKINKVLSMEVADTQAEAIDNKSTLSGIGVNLLSPTYQMEKLISGSMGSRAIGVYAKGVTFNSLAQQAGEKKIVLQTNVEGKESVDKNITIGNLTSKGDFGRKKNLSVRGAKDIEIALVRSVAESLDERVNTATDNEKAQILGRVGMTDIKAVAVDNLLAQLGIDLEVLQIDKKDYNPNNKFHKKAIVENVPVYYTQYSIPYLLHSQPIVVEYFKRLKNNTAIIKGVSKSGEEKILEDLLENYAPKEGEDKKFTGNNLKNSLNDPINTSFQKEILLKYVDLIADSENLRKLQQIVDLSDLGKSMWETKDKIEAFKDLASPLSTLNSSIKGISNLLGDFNAEGKGLKIEGDLYFEPSTNQGVMVGNALSLGRHLFFDYYPYYNSYISEKIEDIVENSGRETGLVKLRETIFQEIKKFITSSKDNAIFLGDASQERKDLFFEQENSPSLSTYISGLLQSKTSSKGINRLKNNILITSLIYAPGVNGEPSLIKFDNTSTGNTLEEDYYISFKELLVSNEALPDKNGEPYTTRMLAQDLVSYSHLSGGIVSMAIEFHKFIPIEYYDQLTKSVKIKSTGEMKEISVTKKLQEYDPRIKDWTVNNRLKGFKKQFYQNNPEFAPQETIKYQKKFISKTSGGLIIKEKKRKNYPDFLSISSLTKSKGKTEKWVLYEKVGSTASYVKVPILGVFGMSEYEYKTENLSSNILTEEGKAEEKRVPIEQGVEEVAVVTKDFTVEKTDTVKTLLEKVKRDNQEYNPTLSTVSETLLTLYGDKVLNTELVLDSELTAKGRYIPNVNKIILNPDAPNLAETFVHEFIHSVTSDYINPYITVNNEIKTNAPAEIIELNEVYQETSRMIQEKFPEEYVEFKKDYKAYKAGTKTTGFTQRQVSLFYPTINIKEYLAASLSNNQEFIKETSKMKYKETSLSIHKKFGKMLKRLLDMIAGEPNNLANFVIQSNLEFLEKSSKRLASTDQDVSGQEVDDMLKILIQSDPMLNTDVSEEGYLEGDFVSLVEADVENTFEATEEMLLPNDTNPCR